MHLYVLILFVPYFLTVFIIYRNLQKIKPFSKALIPRVFASVVIACRNEEKRLKPLLESLKLQDYPDDLFEVIIVDDNSTDQTKAVARSFAGIKNTKIIPNNGSGKKKALRTGIENASGELILTTDADCQAGRRWISTIAAFWMEHKPSMIISPVSLQPVKGFFGRFQELEFLSLQGITAGTSEAGYPTICNGANLAFTKSEYLRNAGNLRYDIQTGDDVFLLHSMKNNHSEIKWLESAWALIVTEPAPDLRRFLNQRKRWASKGTAYRDLASIALGIVTFVTILLLTSLFTLAMIDSRYITLFLLAFAIKSIPDFLVLHNTTKRYGRTDLLKWFLPSQLIYPFYVLFVVVSLLFPNYPSRTGTSLL